MIEFLVTFFLMLVLTVEAWLFGVLFDYAYNSFVRLKRHLRWKKEKKLIDKALRRAEVQYRYIMDAFGHILYLRCENQEAPLTDDEKSMILRHVTQACPNVHVRIIFE